MRTIALCLVLFATTVQAGGTETCIKPKYVRAAMREYYLEHQYPGMSSKTIRSRLPFADGIAVQHLLTDVIDCYLPKNKDQCPAEKKNWNRRDHLSNGYKVLGQMEKEGSITIVEKVFLHDELRLWLEESECSDF